MADTTASDRINDDRLFDGALICRQFARGYRFSVDAVLLAHFPRIRNDESILDLGTGCGVIGLILLYRYAVRNISVTGLERDEEMLTLATDNFRVNGYAKRFTPIKGVVEEIDRQVSAESFSLVIANPPFYQPGSGRTNSEAGTRAARHQQGEGLDGFVRAAAYGLQNRGRAVFVYPASRVVELIDTLRRRRLEPKVLQFVYPYPEPAANARLVLVEALKNGGVGVTIRPPCHIHRRRNGSYSPALQAMYQP